MANTPSDLMANIIASPQVKNDPHLHHGRVRVHRSEITVAVADAANHYYPIGRFKATDRILAVLVTHDDLGAGWANADLGVYPADDSWTAGSEPTALDTDGLADNYDATLEVLVPTLVAFPVVGDMGDPLWLLGAQSAAPAPNTEYDLAWKVISEPAAAGTLQTIILYTSGD